MAYHSSKYAPAERNYGGGEKELLAIYQACVKWHCYIDGVPTTIYTDHEPWVNIWTQPYLSRRQARWLERMNELPITIIYHEGPLNVVADTLSRHPQLEQLYLADKDAAICTKYPKRAAP